MGVPTVLMEDVQCHALVPSLCPGLPRCQMRRPALVAGWRQLPEAPAVCGCWQNAPGALHCWGALASAWGLQVLAPSLSLYREEGWCCTHAMPHSDII